jgi:hypothetical protein
MKIRFAKASLLAAAAVTLSTFFVATPAHASSVSLHCESLYDDFVCDAYFDGYREILKIRWAINGVDRPEYNDQESIFGVCSHYPDNGSYVTVQSTFTGVATNYVRVTSRRKQTFECACSQ